MIALAGILVGAGIGFLAGKRRGYAGADLAQFCAVGGVIGLIAGIIVSVAILRS